MIRGSWNYLELRWFVTKDDPRTQCASASFDYIDYHRPQVVLIETVPGILTNKKLRKRVFGSWMKRPLAYIYSFALDDSKSLAQSFLYQVSNSNSTTTEASWCEGWCWQSILQHIYKHLECQWAWVATGSKEAVSDAQLNSPLVLSKFTMI
jgi:hypothetical protein